MPEPEELIKALRHSHDRLSAVVGSLAEADLTGQSYCSDWTVAQVLSHLGSGAEIFWLFVNAGLHQSEPPPREGLGAIWDRWNAKEPKEQAVDSLAANGTFVTRLESLSSVQLKALRLDLFGRERLAEDLLRMRLSEHALHTWDVAATFDPEATVASDAVELLVDGLPEVASRSGRKTGERLEVLIVTSQPARRFRLVGDEARLESLDEEGSHPPFAGLGMAVPAEALVRLVYGRLDPAHPPRGPVEEEGIGLDRLTELFPGF